MDRNFDAIFERFQARIKTNKKGLLREALIREDLLEQVLVPPQKQLKVLDSGCGLGDMGLWLAQQGHKVLATDISQRMVDHANELARAEGVADRMQAERRSAQDVLQSGQTFDLVCIHAVMEWLHEPYEILPLIAPSLNAGGWISLTIYNLHRSVFNSLVKGDFNRIVASDNYAGASNLMTPPNPIEPERVRQGLESQGLRVQLQAGLRCFYDYFPTKMKQEQSLEDVLTLERRYRKLTPYRDFARYIHFLARKD